MRKGSFINWESRDLWHNATIQRASKAQELEIGFPLSKHNLLSPQGMNPNETPYLQVLTVQNVQRVNINSESPQVKIPISQLPNFRLLWWNGILRISPTAITVSNKRCRGKQLLASCGPEIVIGCCANGTCLDYSTEHNLASNLISFKIRLRGVPWALG